MSHLSTRLPPTGQPTFGMPITAAASSRNEHGQMSLSEMVSRHALVSPDAVAATQGKRSMTYSELEERANQLAYVLGGLGVGPDVVVVLYLNRSLATIVAALAVFKAGGAYVPIDPGYPKERVAFMLEDAHAPIVITGQCTSATLPVRPEHVVIVDPEGACREAKWANPSSVTRGQTTWRT